MREDAVAVDIDLVANVNLVAVSKLHCNSLADPRSPGLDNLLPIAQIAKKESPRMAKEANPIITFQGLLTCPIMTQREALCGR